MSPSELARTLGAAADRIEALAHSRPCRAFRPHGGWRSGQMYAGLRRIDYTLVGWGWMLWDVDWFRPRTADRIVARVTARARAGDIWPRTTAIIAPCRITPDCGGDRVLDSRRLGFTSVRVERRLNMATASPSIRSIENPSSSAGCSCAR